MGEVLTVFLGVVGAGVLGLSASSQGLVLPLLATQILWINLITDSGPALAMGVDPETDDVMARPPRRPGDRAIDARMWVGVMELGLVMALATLLTIDMYLPGGLIEGERDLANARTAGFTVLVLAQLFNCFNARSETTSAFHRLFVNPWLWGAIALSLLLQVAVVNVAMLNVAFGTEPLDATPWLVCAAMGSAVLWFSELRKAAFRTWTAQRTRALEVVAQRVLEGVDAVVRRALAEGQQVGDCRRRHAVVALPWDGSRMTGWERP
jgi:P-type Ca2+ transporter type 2C